MIFQGLSVRIVQLLLYADDSKLYRIINSPEDMSSFQGDLDKISDWVRTIK